MVALGIPEMHICAIVRDHKDRPISIKTLRRHFKKELELGAAELNCYIGAFMVATILGRDPPAGTKAITDDKIRGSLMDLYARSRLGWSTTVRSEIANADGKPFVYVAKQNGRETLSRVLGPFYVGFFGTGPLFSERFLPSRSGARSISGP